MSYGALVAPRTWQPINNMWSQQHSFVAPADQRCAGGPNAVMTDTFLEFLDQSDCYSGNLPGARTLSISNANVLVARQVNPATNNHQRRDCRGEHTSWHASCTRPTDSPDKRLKPTNRRLGIPGQVRFLQVVTGTIKRTFVGAWGASPPSIPQCSAKW
jgi:hypothetical protein